MNEESIFAVALEKQSVAERQAYLSEACGGNAELRAQVDELLRASDDAGSFLNHAPVSAGGTDATIAATRASGDTEKSATWTGTLPFLDPCDKPDRIGKLGHYEIIEVVGYGGMGAVLRALDTKLSRVVAVKVMAPELAASPMAVKRFLREARTAASVHHDHVVTIHNVEETHSPPYLVMQYIDGQTLAQKIEREGALELAHILRIGSQVAAGLAAAHKHGLIHRDVKPANILLENGVERVKITDFGLARAADDMEMTQTGMIAGTPQYMSPEQAKGEPIDMRSDLFSLGSVLYSMCTGRAAFRADNTMGVLRRVCEDVPRPIREVNPEIPEWLAAIVSKLLAKNPADRFQTAAEVAELLSQHLAHVQSPTLVPRPATVVVPPPPVQPAVPFVMPAKMPPASPSGNGAVVAVIVVLGLFMILTPVVIAILLGWIGLAGAGYMIQQRRPPPPMIAPPPLVEPQVAAPTVASPPVNLVEWGKFLDPVGNCKIERRPEMAIFRVPGEIPYNLLPKSPGGMNAPRLLHDAQGDFLMQVRVLPFAKSKAGTSTTGTASWRSAGLVVIVDDETVVRLERVSWGERNAGSPMMHGECFTKGERIADYYGPLSNDERSTLIQMERRGNHLHFRYSDDGSKWENWQTITALALPDRVLVGLVAVHTTPTEFDPCFEDLQFRDAAITEKKSVAVQNSDFPPGSSADILTSDDWEWTEPQNLGLVINSDKADGGPVLSGDGLTLIFHSEREGSQGAADLWLSTRPSLDGEWTAPVNLGSQVNSAESDADAALSADGLTVIFTSRRPGGMGASDLWTSTRADQSQAWSEAVNLGLAVNSDVIEGAPALSADGLAMIFNSDRQGRYGQGDLWLSTRESISAPWSSPRNLGSRLNSPAYQGFATFASDGLSLIYNSNRAGGPWSGPLWISTRATPYAEWSEPTRLWNDSHGAWSACLTADHKTLLFDSKRSGGHGEFDIWMSRRVRKQPSN